MRWNIIGGRKAAVVLLVLAMVQNTLAVPLQERDDSGSDSDTDSGHDSDSDQASSTTTSAVSKATWLGSWDDIPMPTEDGSSSTSTEAEPSSTETEPSSTETEPSTTWTGSPPSATETETAPPKSQCTQKAVRRPWQHLSTDEKHAYLDAELCLMHKEKQFNYPGTRSRFDELQACHIMQAEVVHGVAAFLPFHRLLVFAHEQMLKNECGYEGAHPYWDEPHDAGNFHSSILLDPNDGFGGDGHGNSHCIQDGPFAGYQNGLGPGHDVHDHCIDRQIDESQSALAAQKNVDQCYSIDNFVDAWPCLENAPHIAGHGGIGREMADAISSPGDPIFYLHHAYLDKVFWGWQALDLPHRLTDMGGRNIQDPCIGFPEDSFWENPPDGDFSSAPNQCYQEQYNLRKEISGDPGNVTTLNHVLNMYGLIPDATIGDVMDIGGDLLCYEYEDS